MDLSCARAQAMMISVQSWGAGLIIFCAYIFSILKEKERAEG